jgi:DNA replication and repair protein RecF
MGGESCTLSQIASQVPIQLVDPSVHLIVEEGSARRRRLFDWGVFHVEPRFGQEWRVYQRALRQRNAALRAQMWSVDHALREELQESGERLHIKRETYFRKLVPVLAVVLRELLDDDIEIRYRRGWPDDLTLTDALSAVYDRDRRIRTTTVGPHRADLELTIASGLAREVVSRGQQKLLASALVLAQTRLLTSELARSAVLLIDDPAAELDVDNLGKLLRAVAKTPAQVVATSLVGSSLDALDIGRMFHVKQGQVTPML